MRLKKNVSFKEFDNFLKKIILIITLILTRIISFNFDYFTKKSK